MQCVKPQLSMSLRVGAAREAPTGSASPYATFRFLKGVGHFPRWKRRMR
jgi:hypothetical protein